MKIVTFLCPITDGLTESLKNNHLLTYNIDIAVLVLIFSAAAGSPTMLPLFPDHILNHYAYLRNTMPDLVPQLKVKFIILYSVYESESTIQDHLIS